MSDGRPIPASIPSSHDVNDHGRLRHGRERDVGFAVGRYLQPAPMLFTRDGHNVFLGDLYRGHAAFLVCGGPSLKAHDLSLLNQRGILTLAVNNAATVVRPHLWTSVDDPGNFCDAIWNDPGILKFIPFDHMEKQFLVRDENDRLVPSQAKVGEMPGVIGFRRNEYFRAEQWLHESTFNWGNHSDRVDTDGNKGSRSVFYVALRLLFFLGVRSVYLLGCDFRMELGRPNYAFEQDRSPGSVRSNNSSYRRGPQRIVVDDGRVPTTCTMGQDHIRCKPCKGNRLRKNPKAELPHVRGNVSTSHVPFPAREILSVPTSR